MCLWHLYTSQSMPAFSRRPSTSTLSPDCITIKGGLYEQIKKIYFDNLLVQFSLTTTLPPHDRVRVQLDNDNALESQLLKVQTENFGESPESLGADRVQDAACKITTTCWKALPCLGTYLLRRKVILRELQKESRHCRVPQGNICNWCTPVFTLSLNATNVNNRQQCVEIFLSDPSPIIGYACH